MKYVCGLLLAISFCAVAEETCECPKLACDPCSFQKGITFFTSKCGPAEARLKSCARPTCLPLAQVSAECPVLPKSGEVREPVVVKPAVEQVDPNAEIRIVGNVKVLSGSVSITHADGRRLVVNGESRVRETDTVESAADGKALVTFEGGNKLHVHPETVVQVREYRDQADPASRKALLQLIKGKIRNQVEQKYNGKTSSYRVMTTAAVAGVRGTDFVVEHREGGRLETKVETLGGKVVLASLDEKEMRDILRGEGATFTADLPDASFKGADVSDFIRRGRLSPVYKIPADRMEELDYASRVDVAKAPRRAKPAPARDVEICREPKGYFNQCVWRTRGGACERSRCDANGVWNDTTPARADACSAASPVVKACDY